MAMASSMTVWQRPTSSWRTNSPPQTFSFVVNGLHRFHGFIFCVICVICWLFIFNIGWNGFHGFLLHFRACSWINFCPRCPKHTNSYNYLIIIDITWHLPIKSPKIHWKSLLLYINFANFLSYPFSKLPDSNDVVSSINAYGVNSWHLIGYEGKRKGS